MVISIDSTLLTAYYQARAGVPGTATGSGGTSPGAKTNPTPPWFTGSAAPQVSALAKSVLAGGRFIDPDAAKLDVPHASEDYKKLFSLYQGLNALEGIATQYTAQGTSQATQNAISSRFAAGMKEISAFLDQTKFSAFQLAQGAAVASTETTVGVKRETDTYTTGTLWTGDANTEVPAFQGATAFSMTYTKASGTQVKVDFDLSEMGSTPRTMSAVVNYLNGKLKAAGAFSTFSVVRTAGGPRTTTVGGKQVTLGTNPDSFALKFNGISTEPVAFSAASTAPAVYVGQQVGTTTTTPAVGKTPAKTTSTVAQQLMKFEADPTNLATDDTGDKVSADTLSAAVQAARASAVGPDGSLYLLTDVNAATDGQPIKGQGDVALQKYDSAGNLVFTRTLGAASTASGYALAVSADGSRVAVGGSVTGALDSGDAGVDPKRADSFVAIFDKEGEDVFSQRTGATGDDKVNALTFGADGTLYVQGTASAAVNHQSALGRQDAYVEAFAPTAAGATTPYKSAFTVQYGTASADTPGGVAVSGSSLYVAGVEAGHAIVRQYDLQASGPPVLGATRDLGDLQGGSIAGVAVNQDGSVMVAGTTKADDLSAGSVHGAFSGSQSAFVASLASDLSAGPGESLTFIAGAGTGASSAAAMTVSGGLVYVTGQEAVTPPTGQTTAYDGYAAAIDPTTGQTTWRQDFRGTDRTAAPATIAVDASGASVLDRLGLPKGTIDYSGSQQLTAVTSLRAGDQFNLQVSGGLVQTVTIDPGETLKTLAAKISRATNNYAAVTIEKVKGYDQLKITPVSTRTTIEIDAGKAGRDALASLGLKEGLITTAKDANTKDNVQANYSLKLASTMAVTDAASAKQAQAAISSALGTLRLIYANMTTPVSTAKSTVNPTGKVPAYLTAQIKNYQQALQRLTGGS